MVKIELAWYHPRQISAVFLLDIGLKRLLFTGCPRKNVLWLLKIMGHFFRDTLYFVPPAPNGTTGQPIISTHLRLWQSLEHHPVSRLMFSGLPQKFFSKWCLVGLVYVCHVVVSMKRLLLVLALQEVLGHGPAKRIRLSVTTLATRFFYKNSVFLVQPQYSYGGTFFSLKYSYFYILAIFFYLKQYL